MGETITTEWIGELDRLLRDDLLRSSVRVFRADLRRDRRRVRMARKRIFQIRLRLLGRWLSRAFAATHQYPFPTLRGPEHRGPPGSHGSLLARNDGEAGVTTRQWPGPREAK